MRYRAWPKAATVSTPQCPGDLLGMDIRPAIHRILCALETLGAESGQVGSDLDSLGLRNPAEVTAADPEATVKDRALFTARPKH